MRYEAVTGFARPRLETGVFALRELRLPIQGPPEYNCRLCR